MHASLEAVDSLSLENHLAGELRNATTSTPCDVDELGAKIVHAVHSVVKVLNTLSGLGREILKGEGGMAIGLCFREHLLDVHDGR